jgi:hypothetical protein
MSITAPDASSAPTLHPALVAFFDTHGASTAACKRSAHDGLLDLMRMADGVESHVRELTSQLIAAELEAHDHAFDPKLEWMHTRLTAAGDRVKAFRAAGRELARVLVEVESGFDEDQRQLALMLSHVTSATAP